MEIKIVRVQPDIPRGVAVQWAFTPTPGMRGPYAFTVERSGSPEGEWSAVATVSDSVTYFDDFTSVSDEANLFSVMRSIYYRISIAGTTSEAVNLDGELAQDTEVPLSQLKKRRLLLRRKMIRDETLTLRLFNGVEVAILKRRHFGVRCTICYDPLTKMNTRARCPSCYGTSWQQGYYSPIITYAKINPSPNPVTLTNEGRSEMNQTTMTLLNYPLVEEGDLIVEERSQRRWVVKLISPTEIKRYVIHQTVSVIELPHGAPEYSIAV